MAKKEILKGKLILSLVMAFSLCAIGLQAKTIEEDFENLTLVDVDGNELANSWSWASGMSNGWKVIGGYIDSSGNGEYSLMKGTAQGFLLSDQIGRAHV